jgi:23S rRNA (adenine2503-C2)-methyltransferase
LEDLRGQFALWREPAYRVSQLLEWLYTHRVTTWDAMSNLPKALRQRLQQTWSLYSLQLARAQGADDTTQKFLWRLADGAFIETVLIPASPAMRGEPSDRRTLCVSTQVGCAYGCRFCASGLEGWKRNLLPEEIVEQVLAVERRHAGSQQAATKPDGAGEERRIQTDAAPMQPSDSLAPRSGERVRERGSFNSTGTAPNGTQDRLISNLVIMGMGEPLANYENLMRALRILNAPWGGGIGARKITISTSGLAPQIRRLADEPQQFRLAVSLHGATDQTRGRIMPINKKYPLGELTAACEYYQEKKGRMITLEYILIAGVNDGLDQAPPLARLAHRLRARVNLIPCNKVEGLPWERPSEAAQEAFLAALERQKVAATLRREKGGEIDAACGQLRLKTERMFQRL